MIDHIRVGSEKDHLLLYQAEFAANMPQCCVCSNRGRCQNCSCVKGGRSCSNCHPSKHGKCSNLNKNPVREQSIQVNVHENVQQNSEARLHNEESQHNSQVRRELPTFTPLSEPNFQWSETVNGPTFKEYVNVAYQKIVHWRRNIVSVPSGKVGKAFVTELSRLFRAYGESNALESIALTAAMILPSLLLQKPHPKAKIKEHITCLERRLRLWKEGNIPELLREGTIIQQRLKSFPQRKNKDFLARTFSKLMMTGKIKAALRLLSKAEGSILSIHDQLDPSIETRDINRTVLDELKGKHPPKGDIHLSTLLDQQEREFHPVIFDCINAEAIRKAVLRTNGAAGPSGADANLWKRMCTSFELSSDELCSSLALVAKKLSTNYVDPEGLTSFTASRLIALDKQPGVRPIGIGEVARRIVSKAIITVIYDEIKEVAGTIQLCAGQEVGCEAGVHAMRAIFEDEDCEGILLVDASNAFNLFNRQAALLNIHSLCPSIAITLTNTYRKDANLFIEGETLTSSEGTTQGDPLATAMYALGVLPLIRRLNDVAKQLWFADDAAAGGKLSKLLAWWEKLNQIGPSYGYHPNADKTWLVVKDEHMEHAKDLFSAHGVNLTSSGRKHLGSAIGDTEFLRKYLKNKIHQWSLELESLSDIARSEPHAAYAGFVHGLKSKWMYTMRTTPGISELLSPIEDIIRNKLIPALTGKVSISDSERDLLALPCRLGGLGLTNPTKIASTQYQASQDISKPLVSLILEQKYKLEDNTTFEQRRMKLKVKSQKRTLEVEEAANLKLSDSLKRATELAKEKGSSNWLNTLPLEEFGFALHKSEFRDALSLRYGWLPERMPSKCACSEDFTVDHALNCHRGAFPTIRHNEIRNLTGNLLSEVCHDVGLEPILQPLNGEILSHATSNTEDMARADICARGFWGTGQRAFLDVKVFNPYAQSNKKFSLSSCYKHHERAKKRSYEQRINQVEHGSFTPLIFSTTGGMGRLADIFYRRLASMLAEKRHQPYATMIGWLRCQLSFSLLRSSILCIRGSRSKAHYAPKCPSSVDLLVSESRVNI